MDLWLLIPRVLTFKPSLFITYANNIRRRVKDPFAGVFDIFCEDVCVVAK